MKQTLLSIFPTPRMELMQGDCLELMPDIEDGSIDLTVTSPPYDNLRTYNDKLVWNWEIFTKIAEQLFRVTKQGGVVVWVVGDATIKGVRQVLHLSRLFILKILVLIYMIR